MPRIQVGSTITTFGKNGEVLEETKRPSYLINDDGTKTVLSDAEARQYGIGDIEPEGE